MKLINLTPHQIDIHTTDGVLSLPPSGQVARVSQTSTLVGPLDVDGGHTVVVNRRRMGAVTGLPDQVDGTALVVSALVAAAVPGRADVFSPGDLVRDSSGKPIGCQGLFAA